MKKLLALVLALVMSMSLVTISNADFKDADEISYKEAVEVMNAVGVIAGYDNGNFGAKDTLTRAQAAKIVAYLDLGQKVADAISASGTVFTDVPATAWYAGYVEYCAGAGYVAGVGNGKFDPDAKVTGIQLAKMLLGVLGYKADVEGYTGGDYSLNIARDANKVDLFKGLSIVTSAALTREQAAQMAFNALKATVVEYSGGTSVSTSDGTTVTVNANRYETTTAQEYLASGTSAGQQLVEKLYKSDLKLNKSGNTSFGAPANTWSYKGDVVGDYAETPVATFTAKTSASDVAKALSGYKFIDSSNNTKKIENTTETTIIADVDITHTTATGQSTANIWGLSDSGKTLAKQVADITANGKLVEFYADDDNVITDLVMVEYKTVEAGKVSTDKKTGDVKYIIDGTTYVDYADEDATDSISFTKAPAKGDIVTYTKIGSKVYVYATTNFDGVQTATKTKDGVQTITVSGSAYTVGAYKTGDFNNSTKGDSATYYVDQYGFVVYTDSKSVASTDYAYVLAVEPDVDVEFGETSVAAKAKVLLADGTVAVYPVAFEKDDGDYSIKGIGTVVYDKSAGTAAAAVETNIKGAIEDYVLGYTLDNGTIEFERIKALPTSGTATEENTVYKVGLSTFNTKTTSYAANSDKSVRVDNNTLFVAYNTAKDTATVYSGYDALPKTLTGISSVTAVLKTGTVADTGLASVIFFKVSAALSADSTDEYVYVTNDPEQIVVDKKNKNQFTAYNADGSTFKVIASSSTITAGLYEPNKDNEISGSPIVYNATTAPLVVNNAKLEVDGNMVRSGSTWYNFTDATQVVYVDSDLAEYDGNYATMILVKDTMDIDVIYVTAEG